MILEDVDSSSRGESESDVFLAGCGAHMWPCHTAAPEGLEVVMREACEKAFLTPDDVDLINLQSLEQSMTDSRQYSTLRDFFGKRIGTLGFFSLKSLIGHTLGASGIFDCITAYLILRKEEIPSGLGRSRVKSRGIKTILTHESAFG